MWKKKKKRSKNYQQQNNQEILSGLGSETHEKRERQMSQSFRRNWDVSDTCKMDESSHDRFKLR